VIKGNENHPDPPYRWQFQRVAHWADLDMVVSSEQLALLAESLGLALLDLRKSRPV